MANSFVSLDIVNITGMEAVLKFGFTLLKNDDNSVPLAKNPPGCLSVLILSSVRWND